MLRRQVLLTIVAAFLLSSPTWAGLVADVFYVKMDFTLAETAFVYQLDAKGNLVPLPVSRVDRRTGEIDYSKRGVLWLLGVETHVVRRTPDGILSEPLEQVEDMDRYSRANHHLVFSHVSRTKPPTEIFMDGQRVIAIGQEFTDLWFPAGYAYKISDGYMYPWNWHWHNFGGVPDDEEVYVQVIAYYDDDPDAGYRDLNVFWYDAQPLVSEFCTQPGRRSYDGFRWPVLERQRVVAIMPHVHDHAEQMELVHNGQTRAVFTGEFATRYTYHRSHNRCQNYPWALEEGSLVPKTLNMWYPEEELIFSPGNTVMARSVYNNPHAGPLDAMAIMVTYYERLP